MRAVSERFNMVANPDINLALQVGDALISWVMTTKMPLQSPSSGANRVAKRPQFNSTVSTPVKNAIPFVANHACLGIGYVLVTELSGV